MWKFFKLLAVVLFMTGFMVSCSDDAPDGKDAPLAGGKKMDLMSKLVNGEINGAFKSGRTIKYIRQHGKSKWKKDDEYYIGCYTSLFPSPMIFINSECLIEYMPNVSGAVYGGFIRLPMYWEAYCRKMKREYQIFIRVSYNYDRSQKSLKIGRANFHVEFENSKGYQLSFQYSNAVQDHKQTCVYPNDLTWSYNDELMLIYDNYDQLRTDVISRLKETFGEDRDPASSTANNPVIDFIELEKEMAEQASEFSYWIVNEPI